MNGPDNLLPSPLKAAPLPEVINHTPWPSQYFQHVDPHGEVFHVMVCRISYSLRGMSYEGMALPVPALLPPEQQVPLCEADQYRAEVNASCVLQESDFAPYKPKCDVLLVNAQGYAPGGKPLTRWPVGFSFGEVIDKRFHVTGPRQLKQGLTGWYPTEPEPATQVPIIHELAYGGPNSIAVRLALEAFENDATLAEADRKKVAEALKRLPAFDPANPIGGGRNPGRALEALRTAVALQTHDFGPRERDAYQARAEAALLVAPQLEAWNKPFKGQDDYPVIGVGPVGRWWQPRIALAGTHDAAWKETQWPKSPLDHNYRYWNCAPEDQQIDYPQGGETIALVHLTPRPAPDGGAVRFALPTQDLQLLLRLNAGPLLFAPMHIDTVIIDLAKGTLSIVRRATLTARGDIRQMELGTWPAGTTASFEPGPEHG